MNLWLLAIFGAMLAFLGDCMCVMAARNGQLWMVWVSGLLFASTGPIWFYMSRMTGGSLVIPAVSWNLVASILSFTAVLILEHHQTTRQWIGLLLIFLGVFVRG